MTYKKEILIKALYAWIESQGLNTKKYKLGK